MKKFLTALTLVLALVIACASCIKTDIPTPPSKGNEIEIEELVEFYENITQKQTENEVSLKDAWYVITLEEVNHVIHANDTVDKMHGASSIDFYNPLVEADLTYRVSATTSTERLINGELTGSKTEKGMIIGIDQKAYVESYEVSFEETEPSRSIQSINIVFDVLTAFEEVSLESIVNGFSPLTQSAFLLETESTSTLTVIYEYENTDTKLEQTVVFEFDSLTGAFKSIIVHACKQQVIPTDLGDDYSTQIVEFTCKTSIPLPVFKPEETESGAWA